MEDRQGTSNTGMKIMKDKCWMKEDERQTARNGQLEIDDERQKTKGT